MTYESSKRLASALREVGLEELAKKADADFYNDFFGESATPMLDLDHDLTLAYQAGTLPLTAYSRLRKQLRSGAFDATKEEAELWALQEGHYERH